MATYVKRAKFLLFFSLCWVLNAGAQSQTAQVRETTETILTYPYGDPNPIPSMGINAKVGAYYPYFIFDGFSDEGIDQDWKVVTLTNDFIEVTVLPEVGGKVMGAIERSTGEEFIYLNDVLKFRSIGIRGPWTSGGIEHNFGLDLGHAPWTASEVDYVLRDNPDGSVSCVVGGLDLASRTQWRVDIRLPKDKAYFQTDAFWYNPTALHDAYLSWEVAAYKAAEDLQFYFPGDYYIGHGGDVHSWPIDSEGRNLSLYRENNFGSNKSYHVAGAFPNWFGGYFHDSGFGSGHWAPYDEAPGKKIWVWSLARSGAIWEDLLTDSDGQYIEAQSGVKFNQAGPKSGYTTPYNQLFMRPYYTETKSDYWFPVKGTGGMVDASPAGTLNLDMEESRITVSFCPNIQVRDTLTVRADGKVILLEGLDLQPMQVWQKTINVLDAENRTFEMTIEGLLHYTSERSVATVDRPTHMLPGQDFASAEHLFRVAEDKYSMRDYSGAMNTYQRCLEKEPTHSRALSKVAELYYRRAEYERGLEYVYQVLSNNTYDPEANFMAGVIHKALDHRTLSKEYFSVSARSMEYRSASYLELARSYSLDQDFSTARHYAQKALDYNTYNIPVREILITALRKLNREAQARSEADALLAMDPLNHHARFEQHLLDPSAWGISDFTAAIRNELPYETYLELAIAYASLGLDREAILILEQSPEYPIVSYWLAWLYRDSAPQKSNAYLELARDQSPEFVFPFRLETIPVLEWARMKGPSWQIDYYLGLIYWKALRMEEARQAFDRCGSDPDYGMFYTIRGILTQKEESALIDFQRGTELDPSAWRTWYYLMQHYARTGDYDQQLQVSKILYTRFADNPIVGIAHAKALLDVGKYQECLKVLSEVLVLPAEFANSGHSIYERAGLALALEAVGQGAYKQAIDYLELSRQWPENLGSGKPYEPDTRLQDFIQAYCERQLGNDGDAARMYDQILDYTKHHWAGKSLSHVYLNILALKRQGLDEELADQLKNWQEEMEYDRDWGLSNRLDSKEVQWVMAKYRGEEALVASLEKGVLEEEPGSYFGLLLKLLIQTGQ